MSHLLPIGPVVAVDVTYLEQVSSVTTTSDPCCNAKNAAYLNTTGYACNANKLSVTLCLMIENVNQLVSVIMYIVTSRRMYVLYVV